MSCDNRPAAGAAGAACGLRRPKRVAVLGCTGSIGLQTLDVARRHPESVRIVALAAHSKVEGVAAAAAEFGVPFFYEDWRGGYQRGVDISLQLGLYRQQYCGCVFSERDRYEIVKRPKGEPPKGEFVVVSKHIKMVHSAK